MILGAKQLGKAGDFFVDGVGAVFGGNGNQLGAITPYSFLHTFGKAFKPGHQHKVSIVDGD